MYKSNNTNKRVINCGLVGIKIIDLMPIIITKYPQEISKSAYSSDKNS